MPVLGGPGPRAPLVRIRREGVRARHRVPEGLPHLHDEVADGPVLVELVLVVLHLLEQFFPDLVRARARLDQLLDRLALRLEQEVRDLSWNGKANSRE